MKRLLVLTFSLLASYTHITAQEGQIQDQQILTPANTTKSQTSIVQVDVTYNNKDINDAETVLVRHLSKKLQSNSYKQLLGVFLISAYMCNSLACCYHLQQTEGSRNKFLILLLSLFPLSELISSSQFTFKESEENILAIVQDHDNSEALDPIIERKVRLLFTRLNQDLAYIKPNDASAHLLEVLDKEIDEIKGLKEEAQLPAILNFFERHGSALKQDGYKHELKNNDGKKLVAFLLINSIIIWAPIILKHLHSPHGNQA